MVVTHWHTLARKVPQLAAVDLVAHQQHHALAATPQLALLDKERPEVVGAECILVDRAAGVRHHVRRARHELGVARDAVR